MSADRARGELRALRDRPHAYLSTACRHELHDQCRLTCKFCSAPCLCRCHRGDDPPPLAA